LLPLSLSFYLLRTFLSFAFIPSFQLLLNFPSLLVKLYLPGVFFLRFPPFFPFSFPFLYSFSLPFLISLTSNPPSFSSFLFFFVFCTFFYSSHLSIYSTHSFPFCLLSLHFPFFISLFHLPFLSFLILLLFPLTSSTLFFQPSSILLIYQSTVFTSFSLPPSLFTFRCLSFHHCHLFSLTLLCTKCTPSYVLCLMKPTHTTVPLSLLSPLFLSTFFPSPLCLPYLPLWPFCHMFTCQVEAIYDSQPVKERERGEELPPLY
jgi:hypothetical protein